MRNLKLNAEELAKREARARRFQKEKEIDPEGKTIFAPPKRVFAHPEKLVAKNKEQATKSFLQRNRKNGESVINENSHNQRVNDIKGSKNVFQYHKNVATETETTSVSSSEQITSIPKKNSIRKLRKKLRQIESLEKKLEGMTLNEDQKKKLESKHEIEKQLALLGEQKIGKGNIYT
uniref:Uncharacterized protein n=1 Tax=Aplanochytrium stocchinoi TaxID=215587 RepID=A0A7S3LMM2_9STRA